MTYLEKLRDPRWQKRRLEILSRDDWTCQECHDSTTTLHVHHRYYETGKEPWESPDDALVTLCQSCHEEETEDRAKNEATLLHACRLAGFDSGDLIEIARGFAFIAKVHQPDVMAGAIEWMLRDPCILLAIVEGYLKMLADRRRRSEAAQEAQTPK